MLRIGQLLLLVLIVSLTPVLSGCAQRGNVDTSGVTGTGGPLPATARIFGEGVGELTFRPRDPGIFYLYNVDTGRVVLTQYLDANQQITINPARQTVTLEGFPAQERALSRTHTHRMYFDRIGGR